MTLAIPGDHRGKRRPAWARLFRGIGPLAVPLILPIIVLAGVVAYSVARDAEPGGYGEPGTGLVPGAVTVTGWHRSDRSLVPDGFGQADPGHASPESLVETMVSAARQGEGGEPWVTGAVISKDADAARARVYLPLPEFSRAFVAAEQLLELGLKSDGWYVDDAAVRFHCRRAVRQGVCG